VQFSDGKWKLYNRHKQKYIIGPYEEIGCANINIFVPYQR